MNESVLSPNATFGALEQPSRNAASVAPSPAAQTAGEGANPMRKILLIIGVAIAVFLIFTTYSVRTSLQGSARLSAIKDLYFPVLERVDANIVRLDKMEEQYTQAVMTGERDLISQAADFHSQADTAFADIERLYPQRAGDVATLRAEFKRYEQLAAQTSTAILDKTVTDMASQTTGMNQALGDLRKHIKEFRQSSYDNFVSTLESSQRDARLNLMLGIALGVMNLGFMGVLVFFIRNNVRMMSVIAEQNATLEQRVAERTAQLSQKTQDITAMLQNMKLGVCTVVPGNRIHPEYSAHLRTLAGAEELADQDLMEALFAHSSLGEDRKDQMSVALSAIIGEESMMYDFNAHLLPTEMTLASGATEARTLQMDWNPIMGEEDRIEKMLLILQDVTHLRALERDSAQQREELEIIARILAVSAGKFNDFVDSARSFAAENRDLLENRIASDQEIIAALFRNMHTIKGNARTYDFALITNAAHQAEQTYDRLRKESDFAWSNQLLLDELHAVEAAILRYVEVNEVKLGRGGRAAEHFTHRGAFVTSDELAQLRDLVGRLPSADAGPTAERSLVQLVARLGLTPLERLVSGAADAMPTLARELGKPVPMLAIDDAGVAFNGGFAEALKSALVHLVRNALDHGIETPEERVAAGKPPIGSLHFHAERAQDHILLTIRDDGRGLPLHHLHRKAVESGLIDAATPIVPQALTELIFRSGLSTAGAVTQVSGRGVGMDAVRAFLEHQEADIRAILDDADAPLGFAPFAFHIRIPLAACTL